MAIAPVSSTLSTPAAPTAASLAAPAAAGWGQSALFGLVTPGGIGTMLATGLTQFIRTVVAQGGLHDQPPGGLEDPAAPGEMLEWFARHPGALEEARAQWGGGVGQVTYAGIGGPVIDMFTGEIVEPATDPNWEIKLAELMGQTPSAPPPPTYTPPPPASTPPQLPQAPPTPSGPAAYGVAPDWRDSGMSFISTSLGMLGGLARDIVSGVGSLADEFLPVAQATAPLWGMAAPRAAAVIGGGVPASQEVPAGWTPYEGGQYQMGAPTNLPGGFTLAGGGLPRYDIMVPEEQRIEPYASGVSRRWPSTHVIPYVDDRGRRKVVYYRNMGRPMLWSGDLAAVKRVKRAASKARRRAGGR